MYIQLYGAFRHALEHRATRMLGNNLQPRGKQMAEGNHCLGTLSDEDAWLAALDGLRGRPNEVQPKDDEPEDELLEDKLEDKPEAARTSWRMSTTAGRYRGWGKLDEVAVDKVDVGKTDAEKTNAEGRQRWRRARRPAASLRAASSWSCVGRTGRAGGRGRSRGRSIEGTAECCGRRSTKGRGSMPPASLRSCPRRHRDGR